MRTILVSILLTILSLKPGWSQFNKIRFKQIGINQGMSSNTVNAILRDSKGFMWFGTTAGLNRYDGYHFKIYTPVINDSNTISSSYILCLAEDKDSNIWIGTENGLNKFDPKTEKFIRYFNSSYKNSVNSDYISDLLVDNENKLWIGTGFGLNRYDPKTKLFKSFNSQDFPNGTPNDLIYKLAYDKSGNIYFLTNNGVLWQYDSKTKLFKLLRRFTSNLPFAKRDQLFVSNNNILWIAFGQFVYLFDPHKGTFNILKDGKINFEAAVDAICTDEDGNFWVGTTDKGLNIFDNTASKLLFTFNEGESDEGQSLKGSGINCLYFDKHGIVWVATINGGISLYHKKMFNFQSFRHNILNSKSLNDNRVNCIKQTSDGTIYIGTEKGLEIFDKNYGSFEQVKSISSEPVICVQEDFDKKTWVTTYNGKVYTGRGKDFLLGEFEPIPGLTRSVQSFLEDKSGNKWFGTLGSGVYIMVRDKLTDLKQFSGSSLTNDNVNQVYEDSQGNIWIATAYGINRFSYNKVLTVYVSADNTKLIRINSIFEDSKKRIWAGFHSGLLLYDNEKDRFINFNRKNSLINQQIQGISEDKQGNLWLITSNGLLRLSITDKNIDSIAVKSYYESDGLPGNIFRLNSICRLESGEILIGSINGLGLINPSSIDEYITKPKVSLTELRIYNQIINPGEEINGNIPLINSLPASDKLELSYKENVFSIEFSALSYINPEKCIFKYRLQGFNKTWITTNHDMRIATFTNLNPGKYTFCVKASLDEENWGPENHLIIVVMPPIWLSNYAKGIYLVIIILALALLRHFIRFKERNNMKILQEKEEAQQRHNLDMMKINLFTNISHEFRTPLTLIISPLEKILSENLYKEFEKPLFTMQRNSQRLLHLVNQLLDFRKLEAYGLEFYPSTGDIIAFTRNIILSFNDIAEGKGMKFIFNANVKELLMQFDHDKYDKIIYNLLSNAFKFTPEKGSVAIELNFTEQLNLHIESNEGSSLKQGELIVKVKDTGIGIPQKLQNRIFDRYVQASSNHGPFEHGSGIGLSLVYEYVKLHKGTVNVESEEGKGSCFTVRLPVTKYENKPQGAGTNSPEVFEIFSRPESIGFEDGANITKMKSSILIVEDNEELRFYLKDNLKRQFNVYEADNGQGGFQKAIEMMPDIIISDILMPVMDGIALCLKLKNEKHTSHIPVILLTAMNTDNYKLEGIEAGADDYIVKPFNFKILEARIKKLLQKQKSSQEKFTNIISIEPKEITITSLDEQFIQKAFELVEKNMNNLDFSVEEFSREMAMSRMLLYKKLMALTGKAPLDFIKTMRLKRAAQLLSKSQLNISEISIQVGFGDPKYFSQCFKKEFNMLPSEYQRNNANK